MKTLQKTIKTAEQAAEIIRQLNVGDAYAVDALADIISQDALAGTTTYQLAELASQAALARAHKEDPDGKLPEPAGLRADPRSIAFGWGRSDVEISYINDCWTFGVITPEDSSRYLAAIAAGLEERGW